MPPRGIPSLTSLSANLGVGKHRPSCPGTHHGGSPTATVVPTVPFACSPVDGGCSIRPASIRVWICSLQAGAGEAPERCCFLPSFGSPPSSGFGFPKGSSGSPAGASPIPSGVPARRARCPCSLWCLALSLCRAGAVPRHVVPLESLWLFPALRCVRTHVVPIALAGRTEHPDPLRAPWRGCRIAPLGCSEHGQGGNWHLGAPSPAASWRKPSRTDGACSKREWRPGRGRESSALAVNGIPLLESLPLELYSRCTALRWAEVHGEGRRRNQPQPGRGCGLGCWEAAVGCARHHPVCRSRGRAS